MTLLSELRTQLTAKGYQQASSSTEQLSIAPLVTVHTHPLLSSPVILIGVDEDTAIAYQVEAVNTAVTRK